MSATDTDKTRFALVPRMTAQGYSLEDVTTRRDWVAERTGTSLEHVSACTIDYQAMRGNVENPIGSIQMPLGVAGPLLVKGEHADGQFYVPLATTEGALVRSYERGMMVLARSGGAQTRVLRDENRVAPTFFFEDTIAAVDFSRQVPGQLEEIRQQAEATTRHGKLLRLVPHVLGRQVLLSFEYETGDAQGMNMILKATQAAAEWLLAHSQASHYQIFSGMGSEKRASGYLLNGGKGKKVVAGCRIPAKVLRTYTRATPAQFMDLWQNTMLGHVQAGSLGYNGHYANGLTALFIACGQDVANVANAAVGITNFEVTATGDLYASVTLPALSVATVGGGVGLGSSRECLQMLDCYGAGKARKFAEITAAMVLAGELSFGAAIISGEFVAAHESYGRNRPDEQGAP